MFGSKLAAAQAQLAAAQAQLAAFTAFCTAAGLDTAALLKDPTAYAATLETPTQEAAAAAELAEKKLELVRLRGANDLAAAQDVFISALKTSGVEFTPEQLTAGLTPEAITDAVTAAIDTAAVKKAATQVAAAGHEPLPIAKDGNGTGADTLDDIRAQLATETNPHRRGQLAAKAAALREKQSPGNN